MQSSNATTTTTTNIVDAPPHIKSRELVFGKTPRYVSHMENAENTGSFYIKNNTERTLYWDFGKERVKGPLRYPGRLSMQHLPPDQFVQCFPGKGIPIKPGEVQDVLLKFNVDIDPRCELEIGESSDQDFCSYPDTFTTGLRVYEHKSKGGGGLKVNCPLEYRPELSWTIDVPHPAHHVGQPGGHLGCAFLSIDVEFKNRSGWNFSTRARQQPCRMPMMTSICEM